MDPVSIFMAASAAFNGIKKLVEAGREIEDVLGQIGSWMGKVSELQELDAKKPSIFKRIGGGKSVEQEAMEQLQRKHAVHKQYMELMSMVKLRYGPEAFDELIQMQRQIKMKRQRETIKQSQRRQEFVFAIGYALAFAALGYMLYLLGALAYEMYMEKIS